ncbi:MAG: ubiquinol-cytochrome C chaperone family protein [Pseudomonadota bacterium]
MFGLFRKRDPHLQPATELYGSVVAQARAPEFYRDLMVPDTKEGRFEMIVLHLSLLIDRIRSEAGSADPFAKALTSVFVTDMDDNMREIGIGDLSVPRKVKKTAGALYDRTLQYREISEEGGDGALAAAISENVWSEADHPQAAKLADYRERARASLEKQALADIQSGTCRFPDVHAAPLYS